MHGMDGVQLSLPLEPTNFEDMYEDQTKFLPHNYEEDGSRCYRYYTPVLYRNAIRKMDSDYCERIRFQRERNPETVKKELLRRVSTLKKLWREYFKRNAKIIKGKYGTLTYVNTALEKEWKDEKKEVDEMMKFVGESPEQLREDIICNPHIHACIKENLLGNLDRILKEKEQVS
jgi:hypothetical protein